MDILLKTLLNKIGINESDVVQHRYMDVEFVDRICGVAICLKCETKGMGFYFKGKDIDNHYAFIKRANLAEALKFSTKLGLNVMVTICEVCYIVVNLIPLESVIDSLIKLCINNTKFLEERLVRASIYQFCRDMDSSYSQRYLDTINALGKIAKIDTCLLNLI